MLSAKRIRTVMGTATMLALAAAGWLVPDDAHATDASPGLQWTPVDTHRLDAMRGGFVAPSGLVLSFGIERVAFVNGQLVASNTVHVPDIAQLTPDQAQALAALGQTRIVQIGAGNIVEPGTGLGLVIQNSLDGQSIAARTTLDISVNTLGLFRDLNIGAALQDALNGAGRSP